MTNVLEPAVQSLANGASVNVELLDDGSWLADDPEVECTAVADSALDAIAALLESEAEYLAFLRQSLPSLSRLAAQHLAILERRESRSAASTG